MLTQPNDPQPSPSPPQPNPATPPDSASPSLNPQVTDGQGVRQVAEPMAVAALPDEVSPMAEDSPNQGLEGGERLELGLPPGEQAVTQHMVVPPGALQVLKDHSAFLHKQGKPTAAPGLHQVRKALGTCFRVSV